MSQPHRPRLLSRLFLVLALLVTTTGCRMFGPRATRLEARPTPPTTALEPGAHPLGLGRAGRDGTLYVPRAALQGAPLPLLVLMHGGGGSQRDFWFTFPLAEEAGVVVLALDSRDNTWDGIDSPFGPDVLYIDAALRYTFARVAIDPRRVALGGLSDGASYALAVGRVNGDLFTHLVAVAPGFLAPPGPTVGRPRIYVAHGTRDNIYDVRGSRLYLVPDLRNAGYEVTYREFDGPHTVPPAIARLVLSWLRQEPP